MSYTLQFHEIWASRGEFAWGTLQTLRLTASAMILSLILATLGALAREGRIRTLRLFVAGYVEAIRNTPFLIQLYVVFFCLPVLGLRLGPDAAALVALTMYGTAYTIEIIRSGIASVPKGQYEAARVLELSRVQTLRHIILPQALRVALPALESEFVLLMLGSSVVSAISANELTAAAHHVAAGTYRSFEAYIVSAAIYLALSLVMSLGFVAINRLFLAGHLNR